MLASTAKGCLCPVCDPALTLLSPCRGSWVTLYPVPESVLLNRKWCPPHSAKGSTELSPFAAPGPQLQCVMSFQSKNIWCHSARSPSLEAVGGDGWPRHLQLFSW